MGLNQDQSKSGGGISGEDEDAAAGRQRRGSGTRYYEASRSAAGKRTADPLRKVGRFVRFDPAELDVWLDSQRVDPVSETFSVRLILAVKCTRQTRWPGATAPPAFASQLAGS